MTLQDGNNRQIVAGTQVNLGSDLAFDTYYRAIDGTLVRSPSTPAWSPLTLNTGWSNYAQGFPTASYRRRSDGLTQIKGLIVKSSAAVVQEVIATLPTNCRPIENHMFPSWTSPSSNPDFAHATAGVFFVMSTGQIQWVGGDPTHFFSLEAMYFVDN